MANKGLCCLMVQVAGAVVFAVVATGLVIGVSNSFYHTEESKVRGYTVDVAGMPAATATVTSSASGGATKDNKSVDIAPYLAKADLKLGEQLLKRCQVCHGFEKGKPNGVGPNQYGLVGRKVAAVPGFPYSDAMKAKGGSWGFQQLSDFITEPQKVVPGTKMGFGGLKKPEERAALLVYINKTFSDKPLEIPEK